jgi:glycosyltransferase involved in cell wall biosynthesis
VERTIAELARALTAAGAEVTVLQQVRRQRSTDEYRFAWHLPRLVAGERFDALHASTPVVANRLALAGIPYVYTTHSRHWFLRRGWRERWGYGLERRAVRRSRATLALTERVRDRVAADLGTPGPPLPVVPIGVDTSRFHPDWSARNGRTVLGVGVVQRFKRWELAARALRDLDVELTIVGPTPDAAYASELKAIGPHVRLLGERPEEELVARFASSDLLVHPSEVELLAGVVLQGLASGLPVLGAEPIASLLEPDRTGFSSPAGSPPSAIEAFLRSGAQRLLSDPTLRRSMGEAARRSAEVRFAWPVVAHAHLQVYRSAFPATS